MENIDEARMSFLDHMEDLRRKLMRAVAAVLLAFVVCIVFSEQVFGILAAPIAKLLPKDSSLVFTGLPDPLFQYLKVDFIAAVFITTPYLLYQIWAFIRPGLYDNERKLAIPTVVMATALFYCGALFAYFIVFPAAFQFFLSYQTADLKPMISIREYVSFVMVLMLAFAVVFETPVIVVFLGLLGIFDSSQLKRGRRYFVVLAFIIGAILTPTPDPLNQSLMAVPMIVLFELGVQILAAIERRRKRREEQEEQQDDSVVRDESP